MAPARSNRRIQLDQPVQLANTQPDGDNGSQGGLFLEPMMGTPLTIYIEKDVEDRDPLVDLITVSTFPYAIRLASSSSLLQSHGGAVSPGYSGTPYILGTSPWLISLCLSSTCPVDPHKESGQNLYRQYAGKKGKIVLHYRWVHECIRLGTLQTFQNNWAGCKVTGSEKYV